MCIGSYNYLPVSHTVGPWNSLLWNQTLNSKFLVWLKFPNRTRPVARSLSTNVHTDADTTHWLCHFFFQKKRTVQKEEVERNEHILHILLGDVPYRLNSFRACPQNFRRWVSVTLRLSVRRHGKTPNSLEGFGLNNTLGIFTKFDGHV